VAEYRRGVTKRVWQTVWHFHQQCENYPLATFALSKAKPSDELLCPRCVSLTRDRT